MSILDQARADILRITTDPNGFNDTAYFTAISGETATAICPPNKVGRKFQDDTGMIVNSTNASLVVAESEFGLNYPVRNSQGKVAMIGHLVSVKDSTGVLRHYVVQENIPDESVGLITFLLGEV